MPSPKKVTTRFPSFAFSAILHSCIAGLLALITSDQPLISTPADPEGPAVRYSVQLIHLNVPRYLTEARREESPVFRQIFRNLAGETSSIADKREQNPAMKALRGAAGPRTFSMPDFVMPPPVRQTLVRPDVPPVLLLKQEVPLPDLLPVFDPPLPPYPARQFVVPPLRPPERRAAAAVPAPPEIAGTALAANDLRVLNELVELPRLPLPQPAQPAPITQPAPSAQPVTATPSVNGILAISENPAPPQEFLLVPPANQIARGGVASGNGSTGAGRGGAPAAVWNGLLALAGLGKDVGGAIAGIAALTGEAVGSHVPLPDTLPPLPGTTEIKHPRDGRFGVVVTGTSAAAPYPESFGALSGKVVYTVYVRAGQRKNWILQYCLPKPGIGPSRPEGNRASLDAPWAYDIVRPDHVGDSDYVMVHGMVTKEGHFDQLAMVFPREFEGKDLLFQSLNRWEFRPATQDGEQAAVEVLLIIPREAE
jgi:hypothetical protein